MLTRLSTTGDAALLLERCEYATATLRTQKDAAPSSSTSARPSSPVPFDAFNAEVEAFVRTQQLEGKPLLSDDPQLDNLLIKAIQVLRIHLLELEKVQDLCIDFCQRYITCLRTKLSSENLLRGASGLSVGAGGGFSFEDSSRSSSPSSGDTSPAPPPPPFARVAQPHAGNSSLPLSHSHSSLQPFAPLLRRCLTDDACLRTPLLPSAAYRSPAAGLLPQAARLSSDHESASHLLDPSRDSGNEGDLSDEASNANGSSSGSRKVSQKRGILPKQATSVMRSWLFQHIVVSSPSSCGQKIS